MNKHASNAVPMTLVIGYGNPLRGDDAVGQRVAAAVEAQRWPHMQAMGVHQLTPELAEALATADRALFVDAGPMNEDAAVDVSRIEPARSLPSLGHVSDPSGLLALTEAVYGRCPIAWWFIVPVTSFEFGAELSSQAECGLASAVRRIAGLVEGSHNPNQSISQSGASCVSAYPVD
jgi:hydrogenase maturation protease